MILQQHERKNKQRQRDKRTVPGIILLSLILLIGFSTVVNPTAAAAEAVEAVTAYITVTLQDEDGTPIFAEARDGSQVAVKAVTVSDQDGDGMLTVYDMLYCAHVQLAPGGANDFSTANGSQNTVSAKTLWNRDAAEFTIVGGKQVNFYKELKKNLKYTYEIVSGYHLYLLQYQKTDFFSGISIQNGASGAYSGAQAAQITAMKDQEFTMGLYLVDTTQNSPMKNLKKASGRSIYYKKGNDPAQLAGTTDNTGKIKCTLTEAGDYFFYSAPDDNAVSPAVCVVHVLEQRPTIETVSLALTEGGENILPAFSSATREYTITIPDGTTTLYGRVSANAEQADAVNWYTQRTTDGASWKSASVERSADGESIGTVTVTDANKIKLYLNDRHLNASGDQPLSEECVFTIKRQVQLTGLETSGQTASSADYRTGALDVYVPYDATEATLTPTAADGDTITVDETPVTSGSTAAITLTGQETTVTITVHRDGESYVDGSYTVTFHKADAAAEPVFRENLTQELLEYITEDYSLHLKTLHVLADANGDVCYQWYYNTTDSTEGGTAIPDATDCSFLPPVDQATNRYYYCVASNGAASTASATVHVIVYDASAFSIDWDMTIPDVPEDQAELFEGSEKGFYYQQGDTDVTPLRVKLTLPEGFAEKFQNGTASVSFHWEIDGYSTPTDVPEYTPDTSIAYGLRNWHCIPNVKFADRFYNVTQGTAYTTRVSVYVDRAGDHVPADIAWEGAGTAASPYELSSQTDLETLRTFVSQGYDFAETYLLMISDIELNDQWISIGEGDDSSKGVDWKPFSGILDGGNHVLTYASGTDQPLFKYVREATVKNLIISAPYMKNFGLVSNYAVDYGADGNYNAGFGGSYVPGTPDTIDIINVTIQSGSIIEQSGFIGGFASGANIVNIRDCTVEENVKIGWSKDNNAPAGNSNIGSFGGLFNGTIINCSSAADVYGINFVGGMVGQKGQSMGSYDIINCSFTGTVTSSGQYVGGIAGGGYSASSAPNTPGATIQNCYVSGTITGINRVGGIFGGEPAQIQAWDLSYIQDNCFYGTVSATGENAHHGAIIGELRSLNNLNIIENNYFVEGCGTEQGIGAILYLDTSADVTAADGCTVFDSSVELPDIRGIVLQNRNRTDDPLGKDADHLAAMKSGEEFKDGTVAALLNNSESSLKNWINGTNGPVHSRTPVWSRLSITGSYKTEYLLGDELDLTGAVLTATRSDGVTKPISLEDVQIIGFDNTKLGSQTITLRYGIATCSFVVTVLKPAGEDITVTFTLLGDYIHEEGETDVHTLINDNLEIWLDTASYTVSNNATVLDVVNKAFDTFNDEWGDIVYSFENPSGNYITSITNDGRKLAEFTNGVNSGWMYTLNGVHPNFGVSEQYLEDGDVIVFHYTDDYTKEAWDDNPNFGPAKKVIALIDAIGEVTLESKDAIEAAENAYNALTEEQKALVSNHQKLLDAREAYDALVDQAAADEVIDLINAIGKVNHGSKNAIEAAREAYDALSDAQKALVTNYQTLVDAEKAYDELPVIPVVPGTPTTPSKPSTPAVPEAPSFTDISGHWATDAIEYAVANGLMNGVGNGRFAPNDHTTRGMIVTILARLEGVDTSKGSNWYEAGQQWAMKLGISDGTNMDGQITREQLATMLYRYAQLKGYDVSASASLNAFTDAGSVSEWAQEAMQWAVGVGLMEGSNNQLSPTAPATRAQVATLLMRFIEKLAK